MPMSILDEVDDPPAVAGAQGHDPAAEDPARVVPRCPTRGSAHVAQMLGDNGGVSYVCTACGHTWS